MFLSFKLEEAETRYRTTEREVLAVVKCLAEVKYLVIGHKFPTMIYTDHEALETIMSVGTDAHGRIARWMDRLTEYDYIIHHRPSKTNIMGLADGMSRMPGRYSQTAVSEDSERMSMAVAVSHQGQQSRPSHPTLPAMQQSHAKYQGTKWYGLVTKFLLRPQLSQHLRSSNFPSSPTDFPYRCPLCPSSDRDPQPRSALAAWSRCPPAPDLSKMLIPFHPRQN